MRIKRVDGSFELDWHYTSKQLRIIDYESNTSMKINEVKARLLFQFLCERFGANPDEVTAIVSSKELSPEEKAENVV